MYNILVCDDEKDIVSALRIYLSSQNYNVFEAYNGQEAIDIVNNNTIHCILLDIMMPKVNGIEAMVKIREHSNIPIILISAKSEDVDIVLGLDVGADDYITKPFKAAEVLARVRSQLRRYMHLGQGQQTVDVITIGSISMNDLNKEVSVDGVLVKLTPKEYEILRLLMTHPNQVFSPSEIYEKVWNEDAIGYESSVAVHIRHLREKIEINPANPRYIQVVWGQGYKLVKGVTSNE